MHFTLLHSKKRIGLEPWRIVSYQELDKGTKLHFNDEDEFKSYIEVEESFDEVKKLLDELSGCN